VTDAAPRTLTLSGALIAPCGPACRALAPFLDRADNPAMPQIARLLMPPAHAPMHHAHGRARGCGLLAPPDTPDPPADWRPPPAREGLPRINRDEAAAQVAGTRYTVEQQARHPCATGGAPALAALRADPGTALAELVAMIEAGDTLADWCRLRGLAYTTVRRWLAGHPQRAAAYEAARASRLALHLDQVAELMRELDATPTMTAAELARWRLRFDTRTHRADRLDPRR
jgi:hypothetical protein